MTRSVAMLCGLMRLIPVRSEAIRRSDVVRSVSGTEQTILPRLSSSTTSLSPLFKLPLDGTSTQSDAKEPPKMTKELTGSGQNNSPGKCQPAERRLIVFIIVNVIEEEF